MRITSCHINRYGTFEERRIPDLDQPLVVFLGPNEAGKSTLFDFLTTMLFGFSPADVSRHPYRTSEGELAGSMGFVTGKTLCTVQRTLRSTPKGTLEVGQDGLFGHSTKLRNRPLPELSAVSRELFEAVYALALSDMVRIEGKAWDTIQDRLLGGLNIEQVRNPRDVIADLQKEANKLWRPDRRGRSRAAELREEIRTLRVRIRESRERDRNIRVLDGEINRMREEKEDLESEIRKARSSIRTTDRLLPVKLGLERAAVLDAEAGDLGDLDGIPGQPGNELERLSKDLTELCADLDAQEKSLRRLRSARDVFDDRARDILSRAREIRSWQSRAAVILQRRDEIVQAARGLEESIAEVRQGAIRLVGRDDEDTVRAIGDLSVADLTFELNDLRLAQERLDRARAREEGAALSTGLRTWAPWLFVSVLGAALTITGIVMHEPVVWVPALALASAGVVLILQYAISTRRGHARRSAHVDHMDDLQAALSTKRQEIVARLGDLNILHARWENAPNDVVGQIQAVQSVWEQIGAARASIQDLRLRQGLDEEELQSLAASLGIGPVSDIEETVHRMVTILNEAESLQVAALHASREMELAAEREAELKRKVRRATNERDELESRLRLLGEGDTSRGSHVVEKRRSVARQAEGIREDLQSRFPDLDDLMLEISSLNGSVRLTDDARTDLEEQVDTLTSRVSKLVEGIADREVRVHALRAGPSVADLESEIELLEDELRSVCRERDRLMLLLGLIREADVTFRERHQPDVLKRASTMLRTLTGGRYDRLEITENNDGRLVVHDADSDRLLPVSGPLSRGTLDQIYLTIRLAISEHLDDAGNPLPIFLDEVLVNWDVSRRKNAYHLLDELTRSRQVFYFTCHEWMAAELRQLAGGRVVDV